MFEMLSEGISATVQGHPIIAYGAVFLGGLMSAASPCVLVVMPLIIGYVGGYSGGDRMKAFLYSLAFVMGLSVTFTLLGVAASAVGSLMGGLGIWMYIFLGLIAVVMGFSLMGLFEMPSLIKNGTRPKTKGLAGAFMVGLMFGAVSSPCATPVLAVILAYVASEGQVFYGGSLLFVYALGHCALLLLAGVSIGFVNRFINSKGLTNASAYIKKASGVLLVGVGGYLAIANVIRGV